MILLKWYSIILFLISDLGAIISLVIEEDQEERLKNLLLIILTLPVLIYLFLK